MHLEKLEKIAAITKDVSGIVMHTDQIEPGCLFIALAKAPDRLKHYCLTAKNKGAKYVLTDEQQTEYLDKHDPQLLSTPNLQHNLPRLLKAFYSPGIDQLHITGITGTNGKSSVSYYIFQLINKLELGKAGLINTVFWGTADQLMPSTMTTPDICSLYQKLQWMVDQEVSHVVMEVSSHALEQNRIAGLNINTALFTNLSQDHLDYHQTMENYAASKKKLFVLPNLKKAILNLNDHYGQQLYTELKSNPHKRTQDLQLYTYSLNAYNTNHSYNHNFNHGPNLSNKLTDFYLKGNTLHFPLSHIETRLQSQGSIISINILAAVAAIHTLQSEHKISPDKLAQAIQEIKQAPGRLEKINWQGKTIYIDYAHTPDALTKVLKDIKQTKKKNLWCLLGCGGDRDQGKRSKMGYSSSLYADRLILTNDNPRSEDPEAIVASIISGINQAKANAQQNASLKLSLKQTDIILNRREAIHYALDNSQAGDTILIAGKGHETTQEIQGKFYPFNDKQEVERYFSQHAQEPMKKTKPSNCNTL